MVSRSGGVSMKSLGNYQQLIHCLIDKGRNLHYILNTIR